MQDSGDEDAEEEGIVQTEITSWKTSIHVECQTLEDAAAVFTKLNYKSHRRNSVSVCLDGRSWKVVPAFVH